MDTLEKSSDEILMELFGLCTKAPFYKSVDFSLDHSSLQKFRQLKYGGNTSENASKNYTDAVTGKILSIDDVFNSLGIFTEECTSIKDNERIIDTVGRIIKSNENTKDINKHQMISKFNLHETVEKKKMFKNQNNIANAFDDTEIKGQLRAPPKKINIKSFKNSNIYKLTMKEITEREKVRAENNEGGEMSSISNASDNELFDMNKIQDENQEKESTRKYKKRYKSNDTLKDKHRSSHRKKHMKKRNQQNSKNQIIQNNDRIDRTKNSKHYHHYHHSSSSNESSRNSSSSSKSHRSRNKKYKLHRRKHKSRSHSKTRTRQYGSKSSSKSKFVEKIDKQKLLEIARKNAINLLNQGALPASVIANKDKIAFIKAGDKTVDELIDFCKQLSKKEAKNHSENSESEINSDDERGKPFHHPFQIKERTASIVMNIRNAVSLPIKTAQEKTVELSKQLSLQYPVSSGQQHRKTGTFLSEENTIVSQPSSLIHNSKADLNVSFCYPEKSNALTTYDSAYSYVATNVNNTVLNNINISSIVAQRLEAIRRLNENPQDPIGNTLIQAADSKIQVWAESKVQPGLFTGNTGVKPLTAAELASGYKAWAKKSLVPENMLQVIKDLQAPVFVFFVNMCTGINEFGKLLQMDCIMKSQFTVSKPVYSDRGEALMKKMGWQPGEGLGKYKQGPSTPCEINMKTDRKGLAEQSQNKYFKQPPLLKKVFEFSQNKHPVSLLNEYCSRKKVGVPQYECEEKEGAGRRKLFLFSVTVQGIKYTPKMPFSNKKQSKVEAATICLQSLGILPLNSLVSS
ncbi:hypothetical protein PGB90_006318 [Kerria lacca]